MKNLMKWFSNYGWLLFFLIVFATGIFFIFWMGHISTTNSPVSEIPEIKQYLLDKKSPSESIDNVLANPSPAIRTIPTTHDKTPAVSPKSDNMPYELEPETAHEEELDIDELI